MCGRPVLRAQLPRSWIPLVSGYFRWMPDNTCPRCPFAGTGRLEYPADAGMRQREKSVRS